MNILTILNNKVFQVELRNQLLLEKLKLILSYKLEGVEYSQAFKSGWNGITCLVNNQGKIPLGLLPRTKTWLTEQGEQFEIVDRSIKTKPEKIIDLYPRLKELNMIPRDYQERIAGMPDQAYRGIARACTGAGKSLAAAMIAAKLGRPTCIFVIGLDLLNQFHKFFSNIFEEEIGYVGNGVCSIKRINIVSIWTAARSLEVKDVLADDEMEDNEKFDEDNKIKILRCLTDSRVFILDESHVASTLTIKSLMKVLDPEYIFGLSGTPYREDNSDLLIEGLLGPILIDVPASELIARGFLVAPWIKFVDVPNQRISGNYQTVYKEYVVENDKRNSLIIKETLELIKRGYKPLILFKQIKHGDILAELFKKANINFGYLSGKNSLEQRDEVKDYFNKGKIDAILSSTIFDIGLDIPIASGLVLTGSGRSDIRARQRIGRVIRPFPGKKLAAVVDFNDQVKFLKKHSARRKEIYLSEPGFKILKK